MIRGEYMNMSFSSKFDSWDISIMRSIAVFSLLFVVVSAFGIASEVEMLFSQSEKAYNDYVIALSEKDPKKRQDLFNNALSEYVQIAEKEPIGSIFANIGTLHMYLGEAGLSIFYLNKAKDLQPRNLEIQEKLRAVRGALGLEGRYFTDTYMETISGQTLFSPSEKNGVLIALFLITFVLFSLWVWLSLSGIKTAWCVFLVVSMSIFSLFYGVPYFLQNPKAIVLNSFFLKASYSGGSGMEAASQDTLVIPGEELEVLAIDSNEQWLRVKTARGNIGYISGDVVRLY